MDNIIKHFIRYPVWANTFMLAILGFGFFSVSHIRTSFFPEMKSETIMIQIAYPGASPEEVEKGLTLKIEENLRGMAGIERVTSTSSENTCVIVVTALPRYDMQEMLLDVKNAVDRIIPYPAGAEKPVVYLQKMRHRTLTLALYGEGDLWGLKELAENFRDNLITMEGVSQIDVEGIPRREIAIEVRDTEMRNYGLSFDEITRAVRSANLDISGGKLETSEEEILIRAWGRHYQAQDIDKIIVKSLPNGALIRLGDIAHVKEQWEDSPTRTYYNGKRAVIINVDKTLDEDILNVAETVKNYKDEFNSRYPHVKVAVIYDSTVHLHERIKLLQKNGLIGFLLVMMSLGIFLNLRVAMWVAIGIPISFAGMFVVAAAAGITINVISLFGMILVVGMLVDDAIVVAENIYQNYERGISPFKAAFMGVREVMAPVVTAVLTTMFAFLPFFFFDGRLGKIIWQLALVVTAALAFSLVESFLILPAHLAHSKGLSKRAGGSSLRGRLDSLFLTFNQKIFGRLLQKSMDHKWITVSAPAFLLMLIAGLLKGGFVEVSSFPHIPRENINVDLTLTSGSQEHITDSILAAVEEKVWALNEEFKAGPENGRDAIVSIIRTIGSNGLRDAGSHAGQLRIDLSPGEDRKTEDFTISNRLRQMVGEVPGAQKLSFGGGSRWGKPINISLLGENLHDINRAKMSLKSMLGEYSSLKDVLDSDVQGRREIQMTLTSKAKALGLTLQDVAGQVRQAFFGQEIQRLQRGNDEIQIWVRRAPEDRLTMGQLEDMRIQMRSGEMYPLGELVDYEIERGVVSIVHLDGKREVRVEADLEDPSMAVGAIMDEIKATSIPELLRQSDGIRISYEGRARDNTKFARSAGRSFPLALMGILIILILVFRSYLQASLIFIMIPTGLIGAVLGHFIHGMLLSRLSMFGIIALCGIVINDSIVYIDQINRNLRKGLKVRDAVFQAGLSRLRPILLTTATTVLGLAPLIAETSRQAQFLIPMAVSVAYGLLVGSLVILFGVPALFLILNSFRYRLALLFNPEATRESVEPAVREALNLK